ncbi:hypothetical protein BC827DRAFT_921565 [Russula dissimulans]|nr:hypothetical protein BC827DRAFT_921565 [Russula dissimulans]
MVNFNDPAIFAQDCSVVTRLWHAIAGLYIWEFFTTLDYEWSVIRGNRPYLWTIWVYSLTRLATLLTLIENLIVLNISKPINCQVWVTFELLFAHTTVAAASLLIVLRVNAIWNRNKVVYVIAMGTWVTNLACLIHGIVLLRSVWSPVSNFCMTTNTMVIRLNWIVSLSTDTVLLLIMLLNLFYWRHEHGRVSDLCRLLWTQGLIWLLLATIAYIPPVVFLSLNLNAPFNMMFQIPAQVTLSIAATRIYRSLTDFRSHWASVTIPTPKGRDLTTSDSNPTYVAPIQFNQMEVSVPVDSEQTPEKEGDHYDTCVITDRPPYDRPEGLSV